VFDGCMLEVISAQLPSVALHVMPESWLWFSLTVQLSTSSCLSCVALTHVVYASGRATVLLDAPASALVLPTADKVVCVSG
jgi:hypothetical protein